MVARKDKEFLSAKLKLKEKYQNGEIVSASQFNEELLKLEIAALEKRLAKNVDEGATRLKIQNQLADKRLEQKKAAAAKEEEINKLLQQSETDRIKRENADYELQKKKYAGNAAALEALEKAHQRNITKIRLDEIDDRLKREEETYELQKKQLKNLTSRNSSTSEARPRLANSYGKPKRKKSPGWNSNT